jgi:hypothetical protein
MEKEKQTAKPQETEMPRPELYCVLTSVTKDMTSGLFLAKGEGKVLVREVAREEIHKFNLDFDGVGKYFPGRPQGPAYTGPIDDELMANILIYG